MKLELIFSGLKQYLAPQNFVTYTLNLINNSLDQLPITGCIPHHVCVFRYPMKNNTSFSSESLHIDNLHKVIEYLLVISNLTQSRPFPIQSLTTAARRQLLGEIGKRVGMIHRTQVKLELFIYYLFKSENLFSTRARFSSGYPNILFLGVQIRQCYTHSRFGISTKQKVIIWQPMKKSVTDCVMLRLLVKYLRYCLSAL